MLVRLHHLALRVFGRLPRRIRRVVVRTIAPSFTVGAVCVVTRPDGALLLLRQTYRQRWGLPGGLLQRGEEAATAAVRETAEEVGVDVEVIGPPTVVVDAEPQRVDVVFRARLADGVAPDDVRSVSVEVAEVGWFTPDALPELQHETRQILAAVARLEPAQDRARPA